MSLEISSNNGKIRNQTNGHNNDFKFQITFSQTLDSLTVNNKNCFVKDENGNDLSCGIRYISGSRSVQVVPYEKYQDDIYYYLIVSDKVKTPSGGSLGVDFQVRFKIVNRKVTEITVLRGSQCRRFESEKVKELPKEGLEYFKYPRIVIILISIFYIVLIFSRVFIFNDSLIVILIANTIVFIVCSPIIISLFFRVKKYNQAVEYFNAGDYQKAYKILIKLKNIRGLKKALKIVKKHI